MRELEALLSMVVVAVILAGLARRVGAPYPVFLALGGRQSNGWHPRIIPSR